MRKTVKLGDVLKTGAGGTPLKSQKSFYEGGTVKWLLSGAVCEREIHDSKTHITEDGLANSSAKLFPRNSVLVAMYGATAGQVGILRTEAATNQAVCAIYPSDDYLPEYLYHYLTNYKGTLLLEASGAAQPNLSQVKIKNIPLPLISLAEQKRIVAKLDAAFAEIDKAIELERLKLIDAEKLFEKSLSEKIDEATSSSDYNILDNVVSRLTNGYVGPTRGIYREDGVPYLLARHVKDNVLTFDGKTFVSDEFNEKNQKSLLKEDDVLLVQSGHIGHTAVVPKKHDGHNCHAMIVITTNKDILSGRYLSVILCSPLFRAGLLRLRTGTTVPHLNCGSVKKIKIPTPSLSVQEQIVSFYEKLRVQKQTLESTTKAKIASMAQLKASLLATELQSQQSNTA